MTTLINARFNSADRTFAIHREDLTYFETRFEPALQLYRRVAANHWKTEDLLRILRFASGPRPAKSANAEQDRTWEYLASVSSKPKKPCPIEDAFVAKGPAIYAPLALLVLAAALFELKPEELVFTDEAASVGV